MSYYDHTMILLSFKWILLYIIFGIIIITSLLCYILHYCLIKRKSIKHPNVMYTCMENKVSLLISDQNNTKPGKF